MNNKFTVLKKIFFAIAIYVFAKVVLILYINKYDDLGILDTILNMVYFGVVMIYILKEVKKKTNPNNNGQADNINKSTSPPPLDNKPLNPK